MYIYFWVGRMMPRCSLWGHFFIWTVDSHIFDTLMHTYITFPSMICLDGLDGLLFMYVITFPINVRQSRSDGDSHARYFNSNTIIKMMVEVCLLLVTIYMYSFRDTILYGLILVLYGVHIFLFLDVFMVIPTAVVDACMGA